jgi:hypothetical protein
MRRQENKRIKLMLKPFFIFLLIVNSFESTAQNFNYEIKSDDKIIGSLTVTITKKNDTEDSEVKSEVILPMGIKYGYELKSNFNKKVLIKSGLVIYLNGKVHSSSSTIKKGSYYAIKNDGKKSKYIGIIKYSESLLYTIEPIGKHAIYSDFLGLDKSIKKLEENTYEFVNKSNGNKSMYTYKNGVLESANIEYGIIRFSVNRIL